MINKRIKKINETLFDDHLDLALIWAELQVRELLINSNLNNKERELELTNAITTKYPRLNAEGAAFLTGFAKLTVKLERYEN